MSLIDTDTKRNKLARIWIFEQKTYDTGDVSDVDKIQAYYGLKLMYNLGLVKIIVNKWDYKIKYKPE